MLHLLMLYIGENEDDNKNGQWKVVIWIHTLQSTIYIEQTFSKAVLDSDRVLDNSVDFINWLIC